MIVNHCVFDRIVRLMGDIPLRIVFPRVILDRFN